MVDTCFQLRASLENKLDNYGAEYERSKSCWLMGAIKSELSELNAASDGHRFRGTENALRLKLMLEVSKEVAWEPSPLNCKWQKQQQVQI